MILAACGGGGGGGGGGGNDPPPTDFACTGSGAVTVSGTAAYEYVPAVPTATAARLDFAAAEFRPIRGAQIQAICPDGSSTYDTGVTDENGAYSLTVPENVDVVIRVRALMQQAGTPAWDMRVVDNTQNQAIWSAQGDAFDSATGSATVDLEVPSGWGGSSYAGTRSAAPFAILDSVYLAMQKVLAADGSAVFPALKLNWSPSNTATCDGNNYPFANGCIGTSFFSNFGGSAGRNIFILGNANNDTDEYDNHVVIHEWGHYYEDAFARSDSIGGAHGGGDALDLRVAFGEGWGNAWSAIATDDSLYVDTFGTGTNGFSFDVEDDLEGNNPGWWNESSVQEIIYDLYDAANDDAVTLGFAPIHAVLTGEQRATAAVTSIFPLIHFLKVNNALLAGDIDAVVAEHDIAPIPNEWGDGRTAADDGSEFGGLLGNSEIYVVPVHADLGTVGDGGTANDVCSTNAFNSSSEYNRLGVRRFLRFGVGATGSWNIQATGPAGSDPDFYVTLNGERIALAEGTGPTDTDDVTLATGQTYVLEVLDYENANDDGVGGEACFDITFATN